MTPRHYRTLFYPKQGKNEFYQRLLKQCDNLGIPEIGPGESAEAAFEKELERTDLVMDAIFGFSFEGEPRPPFDTVIRALKSTKKPIVSVDIPSAWNVERGDPEGKYFTPGRLGHLHSLKKATDPCIVHSRRSYFFDCTESWG